MTSQVGGWSVLTLSGDAGDHHGRPLPDRPVRTVWVFEALRPALVLGSTQHDDVVDAEAARSAGIAVVRRRSGGGAVLVVPGETVWIDVVVPAGDRLWEGDVSRAALWLGDTWRAALAGLGLNDGQVHQGALVCGPLGRLVCFGALAAGEVIVPDGRKLVGISQRRTRAAARFQCVAYRTWDPAALTALLRLDETGAAAVAATGTGTGRDPADVVDAFLHHLPA